MIRIARMTDQFKKKSLKNTIKCSNNRICAIQETVYFSVQKIFKKFHLKVFFSLEILGENNIQPYTPQLLHRKNIIVIQKKANKDYKDFKVEIKIKKHFPTNTDIHLYFDSCAMFHGFKEK